MPSRRINEIKATMDLAITTTLLLIAFVVFLLIVTVNPIILNENFMMTIQMVVSIPFLAASSFIRVKMIGIPESKLLDKFSHVTFTIGYALLINSIGIMIFILTTRFISALFFMMNITIALAYSVALVTDKQETLRERMGKDILFVALLVLLGILALPV